MEFYWCIICLGISETKGDNLAILVCPKQITLPPTVTSAGQETTFYLRVASSFQCVFFPPERL